MRIVFLTVVILAAWHKSLLHAQPRTITNDAMVLTLQEQPGIILDSNRALALDSSLRLAKQSLRINPQDDYRYGGFRLDIVEVEFSSSNTLFARSWLQGQLLTGNASVDSVSRLLGLVLVEPITSYRTTIGLVIHRVRLQFRTPLNDSRANLAYRSIGIFFSRFSGGFSNSTSRLAFTSRSLDYISCNNEQYFILGSGSGDCPAGCINYQYSYAAVRQADTGKVVTRERGYGWGDHLAPPYDRPHPHTIPYNFPRYYSVTQFGTADSLIKALSHPIWWVQNHAIQGLRLVFISTVPLGSDSYWFDSARTAQWAAIRQGVLPRRAEIIRILQGAKNSAVCDVAASIDTALAIILTVGVKTEETITMQDFIVAPNPFKNEVRITATLPSQKYVQISLTNTLGSKTATIFEGKQDGKIDIMWSVPTMPEGAYIVQVFVDGQRVHSKQLLYIR